MAFRRAEASLVASNGPSRIVGTSFIKIIQYNPNQNILQSQSEQPYKKVMTNWPYHRLLKHWCCLMWCTWITRLLITTVVCTHWSSLLKWNLLTRIASSRISSVTWITSRSGGTTWVWSVVLRKAWTWSTGRWIRTIIRRGVSRVAWLLWL